MSEPIVSKVPAPWTPVEFEMDTTHAVAKVWGRTYTWDNSLLPVSIQTVGNIIVNIRYTVEYDGFVEMALSIVPFRTVVISERDTVYTGLDRTFYQSRVIFHDSICKFLDYKSVLPHHRQDILAGISVQLFRSCKSASDCVPGINSLSVTSASIPKLSYLSTPNG